MIDGFQILLTRQDPAEIAHGRQQLMLELAQIDRSFFT